MLLKHFVTLTILGTIITFGTTEGKKKKWSKHGKRLKDESFWRFRAGQLEPVPYADVNNTGDSQYEEETYNKYMATMTPQAPDSNQQPTSNKISYPTTLVYEPARWDSQGNNARKTNSSAEYSATPFSLRQETSSPTVDYQNDVNPKFNEEIDILTKNLQQISNDWYYNVRFHCANSWKMIQDILTENRKALNDWQSTLYNIIDMLYFDDTESGDYEDLEEKMDLSDVDSKDYDGLRAEGNTTERVANNKGNEKSKWYEPDKNDYNIDIRPTTENYKININNYSDIGPSNSLKQEYEILANNTNPGSLKLHVSFGNSATDSTSIPPESNVVEADSKNDDHSNGTCQGQSANETSETLRENYHNVLEYLKYYKNDKALADMQKKNYQYNKETTENINEPTTENTWWNYYMQENTDSAKGNYEPTEQAISENPWKHYYENILKESTLYDNYGSTTESWQRENVAKETPETSKLNMDKKYEEMPSTEMTDLRKLPNFDRKKLNKTTPTELMVKATSQKLFQKTKKKKKLYSVKKSDNKQSDKNITPEDKVDDEMSSDINLVEALRMYWKQSILECLAKYMKEVREEEGTARNFNKKMRIITANNLANFTESCRNSNNYGRGEKDEWFTDTWRKLKEHLRNLHQELERRYLNHEVQNLQITMGLETCRQVGLAYENTMHRQVKAIYSSAVRGRYVNKPVADYKNYHKKKRYHSIKKKCSEFLNLPNLDIE